MANVIGLDIGSYSLKLVDMKGSLRGGKELVGIVSEYNPTGKFLPTDETEVQKLAVTLKKVVSENKMKGKPVFACLPENVAYTSIISMPNLSDAELSSSIHWEAEQHIPVPLEEVNLEYEILKRPKKNEVGEKMKVLLVAARRDVIDAYVNVLELAGLEVVGMETVVLGMYRALRQNFLDDAALMVVHIGALTTDLLIVHKGEMVLSYSIQTGGLSLTRAVEKQLELPPNQAEEYKRAYGLNPAELEGRVRQSLSGVMNIIISEIRKAMQYYQTSHTLSPIRTMWLSGGSAYLPGLSTYLTEAFSYEVDIVNPVGSVAVAKGVPIPKDIAAFTPAVGLAMNDE